MLRFRIRPLSMVTREGLQRVDILYEDARSAHLTLEVFRGEKRVAAVPVALSGGSGSVSVLLPEQAEGFPACWQLTDGQGTPVARTEEMWTAPRHRTMFVMLSSHTDIGLHESQYIQRYESVRTVDIVKNLCDRTAQREENDRYRYVMEGTWVWNNYGLDRGEAAARQVVRDYLKKDAAGVCCGIAGNHFQTFGLEELCRSAYEREKLRKMWDIDCHTMAVIDINGIPMSLIAPYAEAGVENIIFAPNHWNPLPSRVWKMDMTKEGCYLNPDAGGGGSRCDVRYDSDLPMVFFWEGEGGSRLLVWASTQYGYGGASIGLFPNKPFVPETVPLMEAKMGSHLPLLDEKYPYDVWLLCCYDDNQEPNLAVADTIAAWNTKWAWPKLRTLGDPDEPFRRLREGYAHQIPVLRGDITGGWYQHPVCAAELLAEKMEVHRLLPTAEKWSSVAAALDGSFGYPAEDFRRAWDSLLLNDEHSYGVSGYQGRRVYETWMQHRDWIEKARATAEAETDRALAAICEKIPAGEETLALFNPTARERREAVETPEGWGIFTVPPLGYRTVAPRELSPLAPVTRTVTAPPVVENRFYRVTFGQTGAMVSLWDKTQGRELLDSTCSFGGNELVYTADNHKTFLVPEKAEFTVTEDALGQTVTVSTRHSALGARVLQTVTLPHREKWIDIDDRIFHAADMVNRNRYHRYLYVAFPFLVENCRRYCHLNGTVAEYARDVTGHGTDVYMAANEWCCAENGDHGAALMMLDSQLVEFDHIHPDKTDFGNAGAGSQVFAYVAADWLQMHLPGGSHLDYRFRFRITSYEGSYRKAGIPELAERYAQPLRQAALKPGKGSLSAGTHSFLQAEPARRLLTLKRAEDGNGLIARFYGGAPERAVLSLPGYETLRRVRVDETEPGAPLRDHGFATFRAEGPALPERPAAVPAPTRGPAPIGSVYTGLITEPVAAPGEEDGMLYLLWGRSMEEDLSHYLLYRSLEPGFRPEESNLVARVLPEEYRVSRYIDRGLKDHTRYFYRVRAVNTAGVEGPLSREFSAYTREPF